jgi:hypothetical protein
MDDNHEEVQEMFQTAQAGYSQTKSSGDKEKSWYWR